MNRATRPLTLATSFHSHLRKFAVPTTLTLLAALATAHTWGGALEASDEARGARIAEELASRTAPFSTLQEQLYFGREERFEEVLSDKELQRDLQVSLEDSSAIIESTPAPSQMPGAWVDAAPLKGDFPEFELLEDLSSERSLERLRQATTLYRASLIPIREAESRIRRQEREVKLQPTQHEWQRKDLEEGLARRARSERATARNEAIRRIVPAMQRLDRIKNQQVIDSSEYIELRSNILKLFVQLQFQNGSPSTAIAAMEEYLALRPEHQSDPEPHRLLAVGYRQQEVHARRAGQREAMSHYIEKKNEHLLRFTELAYGADSIQYESMIERIERDQRQ